MGTIKKTVIFLVLVLAGSVSSIVAFAQEVKTIGTYEGNKAYLEGWKDSCGDFSAWSNPQQMKCSAWMTYQENLYKVPKSLHGLDVYEAGFIASVCSNTFQMNDSSNHKWQDSRSACFANALGRSVFTNLKLIAKQCKDKDHTCYENHLKTVFSGNEPTCEEKIAKVKDTLQQNNAAMVNGNAEQLKNVLQAVIGELKSGSAATSAE